LEFDLVGDGPTPPDALKRLGEAIEIQIKASVKHKNPDNLFTPADGKYFRMFAAGKSVATGKLTIEPVDEVSIEDIETREYSDTDSDCEPIPA
jgi:hypothetical protein